MRFRPADTLNIDSPVLPGLYIEKLLQVAESEGANVTKILSGLGSDYENRQASEQRYTYRQFYELVEALESVSDISGLGFKLGRKEGGVSEGFLGYACISSRDLKQSIETFSRYSDYTGLDISISLSIENNRAALTFTEKYPLGSVLKFSIEELFGFWLALGEQLQGGRLPCTGASVSYKQPTYGFMYGDLLRCPIEFGAERNELYFDTDAMSTPYTTHNESVYQMCISHCETIYRRLGETDAISADVKRVLMNSPSSPPSLEDLAQQYNMTTRTLRRHLKSEGTTFRKILFDVRMSWAADYLKNTAAAPREISYLIGYQEVANFYRNFKRWSGLTPKEYRTKHQA